MGITLLADRMHIGAWCFLAYGFLQLGSAWSIDCTASPSSPFSEQTTYSLSDESRVPDVTGSDCEYSWAKDNLVLANHISSNPEVVVRHGINELITPKCFDNITFSRNCISEGVGHRVHCRPNCSSVALVRSQKRKEIPVTVEASVVAAVVALLLAGLLCVCVCYKFKDKISRMFNCSRPKCIYSNVTKQNGDPRAAEEEAGNA